MRLHAATLLDFRNLAEVRLVFSPGVNVFTGENGQGKTNLLEALDYPALGRSFRGARDPDLIRFGRDSAHVAVTADDDHGNRTTFEFGLDRAGARRVRIDGQTVQRRSDLVGKLHTVVFDPQTVELVRGGPENRRRFLDQAISACDPSYLANLQAYGRALKQKNSLLREHRRRPSGGVSKLRNDLEIWNLELSRQAAPILLKRLEFLRESAPVAQAEHAFFTDAVSSVELVYSTMVTNEKIGADEDELSREIQGVFDYIMDSEMNRGRSLCGPHLDDFKMSLDGVDIRNFGSRGETRSMAIALKMVQGEMVERRTGTYPILFFDDIFSELDASRSGKLQERTISTHQVFIATARDDDIKDWRPAEAGYWTIRDGKVTSRQ